MVENLSRDEPLVMKYAKILNFVEFAVESEPSNMVYTQATPDTIHKGVYDPSQGRDVNTPHNPFVDDTLITKTRRHMPTAMAASIESVYVVLGREKLSERRPPISMDKFAVHKCSLEKQQLGLVIKTRTIPVNLPEKKILRVVTTLTTTWHPHRKSFTLLEGVTLLGNLDHATLVFTWGRHL